MELWKDIRGYDGYQVSNLGRIRTHNKITSSKRAAVRCWKDRVIKPKISDKDHCSRVDLWKDGEHKGFLVHRLVACAFLGEPEDESMTVNHKDGNRLNNSAENLEWLSRGENIRHGFNTGLYHSQKPITLIDTNNNMVHFRSLTQASLYLHRSRTYLSDSIKNNKQAVCASDGSTFKIMKG